METEEVTDPKDIGDVGGIASGAVDAYPYPTNAIDDALAALDAAIATVRERVKRGDLATDPETLSKVYGEEHRKTATGRPKDPPGRVGTKIGEALDRADRRASGAEVCIKTPWSDFNDQLPGKGFWPGLHVLVGGTGAGKSTWALQVALHGARGGVPAAYVGLELEEMQVALRVAAEAAGVSWSRLYTGEASDGERAAARDGGAMLASLPFHIEEAPPMRGWSASNLRALAQSMRAAYPEKVVDGATIAGSRPFVIVVDFLQIVGADEADRRQELRERIGAISYAARAAARDFGAVVLLVSSVARAGYETVSGNTPLSDAYLSAEFHEGTITERPIWNPDAIVGLGKESGEIEYSADSVTIVARVRELAPPMSDHKQDAWRREKNAPLPGLVRIIFATAKSRAGRPAWCELRFNGTRFSDAPDHGAALAQSIMERRPAKADAEKPSAAPDATETGGESGSRTMSLYTDDKPRGRRK